jgi:hypothetical protein
MLVQSIKPNKQKKKVLQMINLLPYKCWIMLFYKYMGLSFYNAWMLDGLWFCCLLQPFNGDLMVSFCLGPLLQQLWVRILTEILVSFMWGSYPASLGDIGGSTQMPICAWQLLHGRTPVEVFLFQLSWNVAIWPILRLCDVKLNQTNKQIKWNVLFLNIIIFSLNIIDVYALHII